MRQADHQKGWPALGRRRQQAGQALIYGLFVLMGGLASLFFLFNVGQLTREKTKLVNASDAVAYSGGVMHARAMNFAAYTNRSLIANEVTIAQMVSLSSWAQYVEEHGTSAMALGCNPENYYVSEPAVSLMLVYTVVCSALGTAAGVGSLDYLSEAVQYAGQLMVGATEVAKTALKGGQTLMMATMPLARQRVMQQVADANYAGDGLVAVDLIPLQDSFYSYGGSGSPIMRTYSGDERGRMAEMATTAVGLDGFTPVRNWSDRALIPTCVDFSGLHYNWVDRTGGTQLMGFDEWRAADQATYNRWSLEFRRFRLPRCRSSAQNLGDGEQLATASGSASTASGNWRYSGIPSFAELSPEALADPDPKVQFATRVTRRRDQTTTSDARSAIATTPRLNAYAGNPAADVYVGLSASEVFFSRPTDRDDGKNELASLFNPYWQVHLMEVSESIRTQAQLRQGAVLP